MNLLLLVVLLLPFTFGSCIGRSGGSTLPPDVDGGMSDAGMVSSDGGSSLDANVLSDSAVPADGG
ncbi:MAG: hypothetical protein AAF645_19685 [Myxococcota bacterium]